MFIYLYIVFYDYIINRILFIQIPSSEYQILNYFSVDKKDFPQFVIADSRLDGNMRKYKMNLEGIYF
jgi:hypothetical protein